MKIQDFYKQNKVKIYYLITALITYASLNLYLKLSFYNIFSMVLFFVILKFYFDYNPNLNSKDKKYCLTLSIIFSLLLAIGNLVSYNIFKENIGFLNLKGFVRILVLFIGFIPLLFRFFAYFFLNLPKIKIFGSNKEKISKSLFFTCFIIIFLLWLILFLRYFPAIMTPDSYYVVHNVIEKIMSDHHTFGHTWFFAFFFNIGRSLFSSINGGVAFFIIFQMLLMSLLYTFLIRYFYNKGLKKWLCLLIAIFIGINPLYSRYSVTLWRDVLFGISFLVIFLCLYDYVNNNFKVKKINTIMFTIFTIFMLFFRNNGIYVFIFMTPFIIAIGKKFKLKKAAYCLIIIACYFIIKGPVFNYFNVSKGLDSEAYSIPIQQISRVIYKNANISNEEYQFLSKLYDVERAKKEYNPTISDRMKETINNDFLKENKSEFFKVWFSLLLKNPGIYFEAYFTQTLGYWYPDVEYWATGGEGQSFFEPDFKSEPLLPEKIGELLDHTTSRKIPFSMFFWSIGLYFFMLIISTFISIYKFGKDQILYYAPFYCLWFTMMLATPVFAELRYVFAIFACMPFLLILSFRKNK